MLKVDSANYISALDHARKLIFSSIVHLTSLKKTVLILSCLCDSEQSRRGPYFQAQSLHLSLEQATY